MIEQTRKEAQYAVNYFLKNLQMGNAQSIYDLNPDFRTPVGALAKTLIDEHGLVIYLMPGEDTSIVHLSDEGLKVLEKGGIQNYLKEKETKQDRSEQIEELTLKKLRFEQIPARFWWVIIVLNAMVSLAVSLIVHWLTNK